MPQNIQVRIGDILISIGANDQSLLSKIPIAYQPFIASGRPDIHLRLTRGDPDVAGADKLFDAAPIWTSYRRTDTLIVKIYENVPGPAMTLCLAPDVKIAELQFAPDAPAPVDPFCGPALELLMINYLARERGVIMHGCGIQVEDKGLLFVGESGAGKSTLTRLWNREKDVAILSDDRTIVRRKGDHYRIYGTPWHGEAKFGVAQSARLDKIFFIRHADSNTLEDIHCIEAVQHLLTCSFPPFWDARGMAFTMDFFSRLAKTVACRRLGFLPDERVIRDIKKADVGMWNAE